MDVIYTLIICGSFLFVAFILWCACALADEFDEVTEEQWEAFLKKEGQKDESTGIFETDRSL